MSNVTGSLMSDVRGAGVRLGAMLLGGAVSLLLAILALGWAPTWEMETFPVIEHETPTMVRKDEEGWVRFALTVSKVRPCQLVPGSEIQWFASLEDGAWVRVPFESLRDSGRGSSILPVGRYRLSTWRIKLPEGTVAHAGYLFYDCHMPWTTVTRLGPFPAWPAEDPSTVDRP